MKEINRIDYSKIDDKGMDQIINCLYMWKKMKPDEDIYFNEKMITIILKSMGNIPNITNEEKNDL